MAQHHHKEAQPPACGAHRNAAVFTPIDLGGFAGCKVKFEKCRWRVWSDAVHIVFDNGSPSRVAALAQALIDLLGTVRVGIKPAHDLALECIELADTLDAFTRVKLFSVGPFGNGANIHAKSTRGLRRAQVLAAQVVLDLAEGFIVEHGCAPVR